MKAEACFSDFGDFPAFRISWRITCSSSGWKTSPSLLSFCEDVSPSGLTQGSSWKVGDVIWKLQMSKKKKKKEENSAKKVVEVDETYVSM